MVNFERGYKKIRKYLSDHPDYNGAIHVLVGIGIGIFMTYPLVGKHPVRWSIVFLTLGILGHLYPWFVKK